MFKGKNILIGVCGSIAAYKIAYLVRELIKQRANVRTVFSENAADFITPLTISTLSKNPVLTEYFDAKTGAWNNHVELANWSDLFLFAPLTANTLSKLANGICDNLLGACYLSFSGPVLLAPAMDLEMWRHSATVDNLSKLVSRENHHLIDPEYGELASGLVGEGRLASTEKIIQGIKEHLVRSEKGIFKDKKVLVTAGPTYEAIDPVRFIGNRSSGKMGFEIAQFLSDEGAEVVMVTGPSNLPTPPGVKRVDIQTSDEMLRECLRFFPSSEITIMTAAVSDYKCKVVASEKLKKSSATLSLDLERTTDILTKLGSQKRTGQILVGFALETENEFENARNKLEKKNLDMIILNSLRDKGAGFGTPTNKVTIIRADGSSLSFPTKSKKEVARDIGMAIESLLQ